MEKGGDHKRKADGSTPLRRKAERGRSGEANPIASSNFIDENQVVTKSLI